MLQRLAVALWTPEVAAALCDRKRIRFPSGVSLGLRALFNAGVKHSDLCSCKKTGKSHNLFALAPYACHSH